MALHLVERAPAGRPARVLLLLPGYGDDAGWFTPHVDALDPERRWHVAVATPPLDGPDGPVWFDQTDTGPDPAQVRAAGAAVAWAGATLLAALALPRGALVVGGFSQGGAVALTTLLDPDLPLRPAGVAALAAFLPPPDPDLRPELASGTPVLVAHGAHDEAVDPLLGRSAAKLLSRSGALVCWAQVEGGHELSGPLAEATRRWLAVVADGEAPGAPPA